ncbi:hypothetical protein VP01_8114g1, partial [Puccinia sorghi]
AGSVLTGVLTGVVVVFEIRSLCEDCGPSHALWALLKWFQIRTKTFNWFLNIINFLVLLITLVLSFRFKYQSRGFFLTVPLCFLADSPMASAEITNTPNTGSSKSP